MPKTPIRRCTLDSSEWDDAVYTDEENGNTWLCALWDTLSCKTTDSPLCWRLDCGNYLWHCPHYKQEG